MTTTDINEYKKIQVFKAVANNFILPEDKDDIITAYQNVTVILTDDEVATLKLR